MAISKAQVKKVVGAGRKMNLAMDAFIRAKPGTKAQEKALERITAATGAFEEAAQTIENAAA